MLYLKYIALSDFTPFSSVISKLGFNIQWEDIRINNDFLEKSHVDFKCTEIDLGFSRNGYNKGKAEKHFNLCPLSYRYCDS